MAVNQVNRRNDRGLQRLLLGNWKEARTNNGVTEVKADMTLFIISPGAGGKECQCVISVGCNNAISPGSLVNKWPTRYHHDNSSLPWQGLLRGNALLEDGKRLQHEVDPKSTASGLFSALVQS